MGEVRESVVGAAADEDVGCLAALAALPAMGPARLRALLAAMGPAEAWAAVCAARLPPAVLEAAGSRGVVDGWASAARKATPSAVMGRLEEAGIGVARRGAPGYPPVLLDDPEPPEVVFWTGRNIAGEGWPSVAVVGTRRCTRYGTEVAVELGRDLAASGVSTVSGLASGIDAAAHAGALSAPAGAPPVAVVATGLDVVYPAANRSLWRRVEASGQVISEAPLGVGPARWRFPARNRIVAGLADVLVVVESHAEGGSMYTVGSALERNRLVMAVPGPVRSPASEGTNRLLAEGAAPACTADDVLCALGMARAGPVQVGPRSPGRSGASSAEPPSPDGAVLEALGWEPLTFDGLASRTRMTPVDLGASLGRLVRSGRVVEERGFLQRRACPDPPPSAPP